MKIKRILSIGLIMALIGGAFTGCSEKEAVNANVSDDDYVLKISYNNSLCEAPIHIAIEKGFFEAEGLKYEMVKADSAHMPEAIGSGQVEAGFGLLGKFLQPIDNGLDMKVTAGIHTGCIKVLVPEDSDIKTVEDLKGKKVGTTGLGAAAPTIITRRSLYHAGLDATADNSDVEFVVYSGSDLAQALQNGAVDAIANGDPQASIAERDYNLRSIIDTATDDEYKDEYCCISFVTGDVAENHPEVAKKFTRAIMKASQWVQDNKEETAKIQVEKEWVAGDPEFNAQVLSNYSYKPSVEGGYDALSITVPDLKAIGLISDAKSADEFINSTFVRFDGLNDTEIFGDAVEDGTEATTEDCCEATTEDCCEETTEIQNQDSTQTVVADCCS